MKTKKGKAHTSMLLVVVFIGKSVFIFCGCILTANVLVKPFFTECMVARSSITNLQVVLRIYSGHQKLYVCSKPVHFDRYTRDTCWMHAQMKTFKKLRQWLAAQTCISWLDCDWTLRNTERPQQRSGDLQCKFLLYSCLYRTSVGWSM